MIGCHGSRSVNAARGPRRALRSQSAISSAENNLPAENIGNRAAVAPDGVGAADAFGAIGIADAQVMSLECLDLAMRAVGKRQRSGGFGRVRPRLS